MASKINVNKYRFNITVDILTFARLLTAIDGKMVNTKKVEGSELFLQRRMQPSDFCAGLIEQAVAGIDPNDEAKAWMREQLSKNKETLKRIEEQIMEERSRRRSVKKGKTGPKPGNPSPKFLAAMKELAEKRKQLKENGVNWRKPNNDKRKTGGK